MWAYLERWCFCAENPPPPPGSVPCLWSRFHSMIVRYTYRTCSIIRPFCIVVRRKRRGGAFNWSLHYCPELTPHPTLQSGFRVTVMLLHGSCRTSWLPQNNNYYSTQWRLQDCRPCTSSTGKNFLVHSLVTCRITDVQRRSEGKDWLHCSLCLHLPRQDKLPRKADLHIYEHKLRR